MKRKLIYLIAFLVILGAVAGPAIYLEMTQGDIIGVSSNQVESTDQDDGEQGVPASRDQPAAVSDQASAGTDNGLPGTEAGQSDPASQQQAAAPGTESAASAPAGDAAAVTAPESGCTVWIAVVGKNGERFYQAGQVLLKEDNKWGVNALGALEATGLPYTTAPTWPDFVYSISGQANSGVSGWMYSVNGDVPMHMASKHPVKTGDRVIWWYSNSMEQPQPLWDDLIQ
jgi:hypothetical protein